MQLNWISLDDERPEVGQTVMVTDGEGVEVVTKGGSIWNVEYVHKECKYAYTHWLPLPRTDGGPDAKDFDSIELKPCPFCGAKNVRVKYKCEKESRVDDSAVEETCAKLEAIDLVGVLLQDLCGSNRIIIADRDRVHAFEMFLHCTEADFVTSASDERILDNGILNAGFSEALTESRVLLDCDTLILNKNAGSRFAELFSESRYDCLLLL